MAGARIRVIKSKLATALSCLYEANELNRGEDPLSPQIHTAIYVMEQSLELLKVHQRLNSRVRRVRRV